MLGVPAKKIRFVSQPGCKLRSDLYAGDRLQQDAPILAIFRRRANLIGGRYRLYRAKIGANDLAIERLLPDGDRDVIVTGSPQHTSLPIGPGAGPSSLERNFHRAYPAGLTRIDADKVIANGPVATYAMLPNVAGALEVERSGALVPATALDIRRWKSRAILGGHIAADEFEDLDFFAPYRVLRPIRLPSGLCGGFSMTFFVPSRNYVAGDLCHSRVYVDDGTLVGR